MPHIELETTAAGHVNLWQRSSAGTRGRTQLVAEETYAGTAVNDIELQALTNNSEWDYCEPFRGLALSLGADVRPLGEDGEYRVSMQCNLTAEQVRHLHAFLSMLLANPDTLELAPDVAADLAKAAKVSK